MISNTSSITLPDCRERVVTTSVRIDPALLTTTDDGRPYGGDVRVGALNNDGTPAFVVYRCGEEEEPVVPCFVAAFDLDGSVLWQVGAGGVQPVRPGPLAVADVDGDGRTEVVHLYRKRDDRSGRSRVAGSLAGTAIQIRDAETGTLKRESRPDAFNELAGSGANWVHQRIVLADLTGNPSGKDFVMKSGTRVLAFSRELEPLWRHDCPWSAYGHCPAYIPAVGDIDGDGRDEVNGGYLMLDHDGRVLWECDLAPHMDSVAIAPWDDGRSRALCSGHGHVMDEHGAVVLRLGAELVPHGQELRPGRFISGSASPQMAIRWNGHHPDILVANERGDVLARLRINESPNNTGMETIRWNGADGPDLLFNGGMLWNLEHGVGAELPNLAPPRGRGRMDWYHCAPLPLGDRDGLFVYNPYEPDLHVVAPEGAAVSGGFAPTARTWNARLLD